MNGEDRQGLPRPELAARLGAHDYLLLLLNRTHNSNSNGSRHTVELV